MRKIASLIFFIVIVLSSLPVTADQTVIPDYDTARDKYLYSKVYPGGGKTFYCQADFKNRTGLQVEHVFAAAWMKDAAGCPGLSRKQCREVSDRFNLMEADLHNLFPALKETNQARSDNAFGIIGEDDDKKVFDHPRVRGKCDFEVDPDADLVEPGKEVRGDIARAIFYMHHEYGADVDPEMGKLLIKWNKDDPPSEFEKRRNNKIAELQGTRNPYIDNPSLADSLSFAVVGTAGPTRECLIKGNISRSGKIYHIPGSRFYDRVEIDESKGERWFCTAEEAIAAGWRAPSE